MNPDRTSVDGATLLVDRLATLLRARAVYPEGHARITAAADALAAALEPRGAVNVVVRAAAARVEGMRVELDRPPRDWLAAAFRKVRLGGLRFRSGATADDLAAFATAFAASFAANLPLTVDAGDRAAVEPVELRVHGSHVADPVGDGLPSDLDLGKPTDVARETLVQRLADAPGVREQLARIQARIDALDDQGDPSEAFDLLPRIAELVLADVGTDLQRAELTVEQVLDWILRRIDDLDGSRRVEVELGRIVRDVATRYFAREQQPDRSSEEPSLPTGRPEDARITDDLPTLLADLDALPAFDPNHSFEAPAEVDAHVASILTQVACVGRETTRPRAASMLGSLLERRPDLAETTLDAVLLTGDERVRRALVDALCQAGALDSLVTRPSFDPAELVNRFPLGFAAWLARRDPRDRDSDECIVAILAAVPMPNLAAGIVQVVADGTAAESLARVLARQRSRALLARLSAVDDAGVRAMLLATLREVALPARDETILRVLPSESIPASFVRRLCADPPQEKGLIAEGGFLLRCFIEDSAGAARHVERRLAAIRALIYYPTVETRGLLVELSRRWPFGRESRAARTAAASTLRRLSD